MSGAGIEVAVNVYDLHDSNSTLHNIGVGFYHTGVEIRGWEYSFSDVGIQRTKPRLADFGAFREQINMGVFPGTMNDVYRIVDEMGRGTFAPNEYHTISLNCNHFSDALCQQLVGQSIPPWINRMATIGSSVLPHSSSNNKQPAVKSTASSTAFIAPGNVRIAAEPAKVATAPQTTAGTPESSTHWTSSIFCWLGGSVNPSSSSRSNSTPSTSGSVNQKQSTGGPAGASAALGGGEGGDGKKELTEKQRALLLRVKSPKS